jgi:hypothetical protein
MKKFYSLFLPRPPKRMPKLQEKPTALKREHPALQNMKFLYFYLFLCVIFAILDPDPATQINADPCGSGSKTLVLGLCSDDFYKFSLQSNLCTCFDENYLIILQKEQEKTFIKPPMISKNQSQSYK